MNAPFRRPDACERAAQALSLRLDGELSALGSARLEAHLARCAACRAQEEDLAAFTGLLRNAPLEALPPLELPRAGRMRMRSMRALRPVALVGAMASVALFSVGSSLQHRPSLNPPPGSFLNENSALAKKRLSGTQANAHRPPATVVARDVARQRFEQLQIERGVVS